MTWKLEGYDTFDGAYYPMGTIPKQGGGTIDGMKPRYDTEAEARADAAKALADLERTQPTSSSGGQDFGGIQDRVYLVHPDGRRERIHG